MQKSISPPNLRKILQPRNVVHLTFAAEMPIRDAFRQGLLQLLRHQGVGFIQKAGMTAGGASGSVLELPAT
jgi:hypothetical protein